MKSNIRGMTIVPKPNTNLKYYIASKSKIQVQLPKVPCLVLLQMFA